MKVISLAETASLSKCSNILSVDFAVITGIVGRGGGSLFFVVLSVHFGGAGRGWSWGVGGEASTFSDVSLPLCIHECLCTYMYTLKQRMYAD